MVVANLGDILLVGSIKIFHPNNDKFDPNVVGSRDICVPVTVSIAGADRLRSWVNVCKVMQE